MKPAARILAARILGSDGFVITFTCDICHTTRTSTITGQAMAAISRTTSAGFVCRSSGIAFYELDDAKLAGCACPS
jgi:hypothetical protein